MKKQILNWKTIDIVLLDLDGTLLDLNFDNYFWTYFLPKEYAEIFSIPEDQANEFIKKSLAEKAGTLEWYDVDYWSDRFDLDLIKMKKKISLKISERPNATEFLNAVYESGKKLVMVTNAHRKTLQIKIYHLVIQK